MPLSLKIPLTLLQQIADSVGNQQEHIAVTDHTSISYHTIAINKNILQLSDIGQIILQYHIISYNSNVLIDVLLADL